MDWLIHPDLLGGLFVAVALVAWYLGRRAGPKAVKGQPHPRFGDTANGATAGHSARHRVGNRIAQRRQPVWQTIKERADRARTLRARTTVQENLAVARKMSRLDPMNAPVDIDLIKGRQRAEDLRRLQAGEVTPEELQRENSFIRSPADIIHTDFSPKGTPEEWARIIRIIERS
jgi:hypothetical protein